MLEPYEARKDPPETYLVIVEAGPNNPHHATPMASESLSQLLAWLQTNAKGHSYTLWTQQGVMLCYMARGQIG